MELICLLRLFFYSVLTLIPAVENLKNCHANTLTQFIARYHKITPTKYFTHHTCR